MADFSRRPDVVGHVVLIAPHADAIATPWRRRGYPTLGRMRGAVESDVALFPTQRPGLKETHLPRERSVAATTPPLGETVQFAPTAELVHQLSNLPANTRQVLDETAG
jgi:hypothetical protein